MYGVEKGKDLSSTLNPQKWESKIRLDPPPSYHSLTKNGFENGNKSHRKLDRVKKCSEVYVPSVFNEGVGRGIFQKYNLHTKSEEEKERSFFGS